MLADSALKRRRQLRTVAVFDLAFNLIRLFGLDDNLVRPSGRNELFFGASRTGRHAGSAAQLHVSQRTPRCTTALERDGSHFRR